MDVQRQRGHRGGGMVCLMTKGQACLNTPHLPTPLTPGFYGCVIRLLGWVLGGGGGARAGVEKSCGKSNLQMAVEGNWPRSACLGGSRGHRAQDAAFPTKSPRVQGARHSLQGSLPGLQRKLAVPGRVFWKRSVPHDQDSGLPRRRHLCAPVDKDASFSEKISEVLSG